MPRQPNELETVTKGFELSKEVRKRLDMEPHGNRRWIAENLFRAYYGLKPVNIEQIKGRIE